MRIVVALLAAMTLTPCCHAQISQSSAEPAGTDTAPVQSESTADVYFIVDASGSTPPKLYREIETRIDEYVAAMPAQATLSVTFFGAEPESSKDRVPCGAKISPGPTFPKSAALPPFPKQGRTSDESAIGEALEAVLDAAGDDSKIVLFTDGLDTCQADFIDIRTRFPTPSLTVEFVPSDARYALGAIQLPGHNAIEHKDAERGRFDVTDISFDFSKTTQLAPVDSTNDWKFVGWFNKYLWILCYALIAASAIALGRKFDKLSVKVKKNIEEWRMHLQSQLDGRPSSDHPELLDIKKEANSSSVARSHDWFVGCLALALPAFIGLSLFEDVDQKYAHWVLPSLAILTIFALLVVWFVHEASKKMRRHEAVVWLSRSVPWRISMVVGLGIIAIGSFFLVDLNASKSAAWFVLSSSFATAFAVLGTAPFIFLGACWLECQRAQQTCLLIEAQSTSAEVRAMRDKAIFLSQQREDLRRRLRTKFYEASSWRVAFQGWSAIQFNRQSNSLLRRIKDLIYKQVGEKPAGLSYPESIKADEAAIGILDAFVSSDTPLDFLKAAVELSSIHTEFKTQLSALIEAIKAGNPIRIRDRLEATAKSKSAASSAGSKS